MASHRFAALGAVFTPTVFFLICASTSACKRPRAEIDGIGSFKLGHTTVAEVGACSKRGDMTYCSNNGAVAIGGQTGNVDLYFTGPERDRKLTEILVVVRRCRPEPIERELRKELGNATGQVGGNTAWVGKKATIIARLPAEKGVCEVTFLDPSETERIAELAPPGVDLTSPTSQQ